MWGIFKDTDGISDITQFTDDKCKDWAGTSNIGNVVKTETDTYYKLYFISDVEYRAEKRFIEIHCILQRKDSGDLLEVSMSFNKNNPNMLSRSEIEEIAKSITLENFTADDLGK